MWTNIMISQILQGTVYMFIIRINGVVVYSENNNQTQSFENVYVYASDPSFEVQDGLIENFFIINDISNNTILPNIILSEDNKLMPVIIFPVDFVSIKKETTLFRNSYIATLNVFSKVFSVSFNIKPLKFTNGLKSVIHLTLENDFGDYGNRNPAIFFHADGSGKLVIYFAVNGNANYYIETPPLKLGQWSSVKIYQSFLDSKYWLSVYLNEVVINRTENLDPRSFINMKVYASDPWYEAQNATITDLLIINGKTEYLVGNTPTPLVKGWTIAKVPKLDKDYLISLDLNPNSFTARWHSIISIGYENYPHRVLAIWLHQDGDGKLQISLPDNKMLPIVILPYDGANQSEIDDFHEEINLMKGIGYHKNIVNMIGCSTIKKPLCLVVEYMENGDLLMFLRNKRSKLRTSKTDGELSVSFMYTQTYQQTIETTISENCATGFEPYQIPLDVVGLITPNDLLSFAWQVASGMEYLSCTKLVHRDLAARNILVGAEKNIKISDFGLTRKVNDELNYMSNKNRRLPVKWMSVEAIFDQMFTSCSDVWAYGVVLYEIVTLGGTPYPSISNRELLTLLKSGYRMERPENCSEAMYDVMLRCWNEDPLQRPTFTELREHFDKIMCQGDSYCNFEIDEKNTCYTAASFNSLSIESGDDALEEDIFQKPVHVKSIEGIRT